jgi:hypothetical protein
MDMTKTGCIVCDSLQKGSLDHNTMQLKAKKLNRVMGLSLGIFLAVGIIADSGSMVAYGTENSQYAAQTNDCGNGFLASGVYCANDLSTIQGDNNNVVNKRITPSSTQGSYGGSSLDNMMSASDETHDDEQDTGIPADEETDNGLSSNPSGSTEDPDERVFPCCDDMPISVAV